MFLVAPYVRSVVSLRSHRYVASSFKPFHLAYLACLTHWVVHWAFFGHLGHLGQFDLLDRFAPPGALSGSFFEESVPFLGDKVGEAPPRGQERRPLRNRLVYGRIDDPAGVPGLFGDEPEI